MIRISGTGRKAPEIDEKRKQYSGPENSENFAAWNTDSIKSPVSMPYYPTWVM
jgi:hypothetical protein